MALVISGTSQSTQNYNSMSRTFTPTEESKTYTADPLGANIGDRIIPYNPARWSNQIFIGTPRVTATFNADDNSITITKIEMIDKRFINMSNGLTGLTCVTGYYNYYFWSLSANAWQWAYYYQTANGRVSADYTNNLGSSTVWTGSKKLAPGEKWTFNWVQSRDNAGLVRTGTVTISNTYEKIVRTQPKVSVEAKPSGTSATVGTFETSGDYGQCDQRVNSASWWLYADEEMTQLVQSGSGESGSIANLSPNKQYWIKVIRSNGCLDSDPAVATFTTLTPNNISDSRAKSWNTICGRYTVNYGGKRYDPNTCIWYRAKGTDEWKQGPCSNTTTVADFCIEDLDENTCYEIQGRTTTDAGTYTGNTVTTCTLKKCVQASITSVETSIDEKTIETTAEICIDWEAFASPSTIYLEYRVKDGYDKTWLESEHINITDPLPESGSLKGSHCFILHDLFPNLTEYEVCIVGVAEQEECEIRTEVEHFTTPLMPEPDPVKVCETMTYLSELVCQAVKELYEGDMDIFANDTTAALCDPYNDKPTHLSLWSRLLRYFQAMDCLLCGMADVGLKAGSEHQYYVGEIGWVDMLEELVDPENPDSWKLVFSEAIRRYIDDKIHEVWHYHGAVDYILDELSGIPDDAQTLLILADNTVYEKDPQNGTWVKSETIPQPDDFAAYHINKESYTTGLKTVKAGSAYYFFEGTWNLLDANISWLVKVIDLIWDKMDQVSHYPGGDAITRIGVADRLDFNCNNYPVGERSVVFITEPHDVPTPGMWRITFTTGPNATIIADQDVLDGAVAQKPVDPQRTGYSFDGWYLRGTNTSFNWSQAIRESYNLEAKWSPLPVTVSFNINGAGGTPPAPISTVYGATIELPTDETFEYPGGRFLGWKRHGVEFTSKDPVLGDTELFAYYALDEFDVVFHVEGGDGGDQTIHLNYGEGVNADSVTTPTKQDFIFVGWFTSPQPGTGAEFKFSNPLFGTTDVYARWIPRYYNVNFDMAGGTPQYPVQKVEYNGFATDPGIPTRAGYVFVWWMKAGNQAKFDFASTPITSDLTLIARWSTTITIQFEDSFGEQLYAPQTVVAGFGLSNPPANPTREGQTFSGWALPSGEMIDILTHRFTESTTLTAIFTNN